MAGLGTEKIAPSPLKPESPEPPRRRQRRWPRQLPPRPRRPRLALGHRRREHQLNLRYSTHPLSCPWPLYVDPVPPVSRARPHGNSRSGNTTMTEMTTTTIKVSAIIIIMYTWSEGYDCLMYNKSFSWSCRGPRNRDVDDVKHCSPAVSVNISNLRTCFSPSSSSLCYHVHYYNNNCMYKRSRRISIFYVIYYILRVYTRKTGSVNEISLHPRWVNGVTLSPPRSTALALPL